MFLKNCFFYFSLICRSNFFLRKNDLKKASYKKINQNNGRESTVNRALDGSIYPG
jgi:hypothetical protein